MCNFKSQWELWETWEIQFTEKSRTSCDASNPNLHSSFSVLERCPLAGSFPNFTIHTSPPSNVPRLPLRLPCRHRPPFCTHLTVSSSQFPPAHAPTAAR